MKDWLLILCVAVIAFLGFQLSHEPQPPSPIAGPAPLAASTPATLPPRLSTPVPAIPTPPVTTEDQAIFTARVHQALRRAKAKYPQLLADNTEISIRFRYRADLLAADHSPKLQDPNWPLTLADECAVAAGVAARSTPAPVAPVRRVALVPPTPPPVRTTLAQQPVAALRTGYLASPSLQPATLRALPKAASAPQTNALPFITMDAGSIGNGNDYTYNWISGWGSYDMSFRQSVGLHVGLRNMSRGKADLNLRWVFFARRTSNNERYVFAAGSKPFDLEPGQTAAMPIDSPLVESREEKYVALGEQYLQGSKYEGWLVQVVDRSSDAVIKQTGSTSYLEDLAKRSNYAALIADYSRSVGASSPVTAAR